MLIKTWPFLKNIFFKLDPEKAHYLSMNLLAFALRIPVFSTVLKNSFKPKIESKSINIAGLKFKNKLGLAAGFDKDGNWLELLKHLGFGHIELGTVTPKSQSGNPKPRLFRLIEDKAIINRMGFNNMGVESLVNKLSKFKNRDGLIIGGNIGKNKDTAPENANEDYLICFKILHPHVDYFTINISSPNTPGLRLLQEKDAVNTLLAAIQKSNFSFPNSKPVFLKIAPDLSETALLDILEAVEKNKINGIIVTNTTLDRPDSLQSTFKTETGGLSGAPLTDLAAGVLNFLSKNAKSNILFIGVGGIMNVEDATSRLKNGASLIQIYSGLIFNGPWFPKQILESIES